ncbi:MAG: LysM peptidoglycan-binding domain-containing protein [Thermodesulfobacteriota bacterium]
MKNKFLISISFVLILLSPGILLAQKGTVKLEGGVKIYTIKKGDTLWHISERFLDDPFRWPALWGGNPYIHNPHLIYPGNIVRITPEGIEVIGREEIIGLVPEGLPLDKLKPPVEDIPIAEEEPSLPPAIRIESPFMQRSTFISKKEFDTSGAIVQPKEDKMLLAQDDFVFVSFAEGVDVEVDDRFSIFTVDETVRHPITGKKVGFLVEMLGIAEITKVGDALEARIDVSYREIEKGAKLKPLGPLMKEAVVKIPETSVKGVIIATAEKKRGVAENDIVYIDKGEEDGLEVGNLMGIYRERKSVKDPMKKKKKIKLPPIKLGELILIDVKEDTATAFIFKSVKPARSGDIVSSIMEIETIEGYD